jgi:hypothetical protein
MELRQGIYTDFPNLFYRQKNEGGKKLSTENTIERL